jgi:PAS domain S-box-containing protein
MVEPVNMIGMVQNGTSTVIAPSSILGTVSGALPTNGNSKMMRDLKTSILIVDDRADKLLALEAILSSLGQNIVKARSGKEALRQLLKNDFAVILMDVSMPGMDGFETAALIRKRINSEHTPIIFVTSISNTENHVSRGYSLGAVDYLLTPIVPEILRAKVLVFVELQQQTELIKRQAEQLRQAEEARHQRELADAEDRLQAGTRRNRFFTLAPEMLGIANMDGYLLQANASWERVLGYPEAELKQVCGLELIHPEERQGMAAKMEMLRSGSTIEHFEGRFRHKDGTYRWLTLAAVPFLAEKLIYIFARNITPRKAAEQQISLLNVELHQRVADLTAANEELEAFNYSIAHDLRSPLRSMSGFSQALLEDEASNLSQLGLDYARRISRSAKYMDTLLLDLLNYSRLTRTEMPPDLIRLEGPVEEVLAVVEPEIRERNATIKVVSPLGQVYAHQPTLKQILSNLICNSLKFISTDRVPELRIFTEQRQDFVRICVEDNGIGIAPEHHEKIFGLFQRLHDTERYPGTGIGLALVRKGAERMCGRAGVESRLNEGSRFWVDLPSNNESLPAAVTI